MRVLAAIVATAFFGTAHFTPSHATTASNECRVVESEYREDVSITTCNGVATISVRFMSLGPGGCAVEAREDKIPNPGKVAVFALPGVWTGWSVIQNHLGVYSTKIVNDVKCDTGVRSQVRYWADR